MDFKYAYYFLCNGEKLVIQRRDMPDTRIYDNSCAATIAIGPDDVSADDWIVRERDRDVPDGAELSCYEFNQASLEFLKRFIARNDDMITNNDRFQYGLWADWDTFGEYHVQHMAFINTLSEISGGKEKVIFFTPDYQINSFLSQITSGKCDFTVGNASAGSTMFDEIKTAIATASRNTQETTPVEWDGVRYLFISTDCPDAVAKRILKFRIKLIADKWNGYELADRVTHLVSG